MEPVTGLGTQTTLQGVVTKDTKIQIQIQIQKYKYKAHITLLKSIKCNTIKVFYGHIKIVNAA